MAVGGIKSETESERSMSGALALIDAFSVRGRT
jgi:hypothetical protein